MCVLSLRAGWQDQQWFWALALALFQLSRLCKEALLQKQERGSHWGCVLWVCGISEAQLYLNLCTNGLSNGCLRLQLKNRFLNRPLGWLGNCFLWRWNLVMKSLAVKPQRSLRDYLPFLTFPLLFFERKGLRSAGLLFFLGLQQYGCSVQDFDSASWHK